MKIILLKGLPGSGRTTWAKEQVHKGNFVIVSKDEIRKMFGGYKPNREKEVIRIRNKLIEQAIQMRRNVIVDDTNLNPKHERHIARMARDLGCKFEINDSFLEVPPEECIRRDLHRGEKAVGADTIWRMYYKWVAPDPVKKLNKEFSKPRVVICDLDGCLALNLENRDIHDLERVHEDTADPFLTCVIDALDNYGLEVSGDKYPKIIIVSGRREAEREVTEAWLKQYGIPYAELHLRKPGDMREDYAVKEEIYHEALEPKYAVLGVFEDDNRCCRMWRRLGLRVAQMGWPEIEK